METKREVIIGIPVRNDLDSFTAMISSLIKSTTYYKKIIIIESDSSDGTNEFCDYLATAYPNIEVVHTPKEGPLKAYNRLFKLAVDEQCDLLLTQTDVLFYPLYKRDWLQIMNEYARYETVGAITTLNGGGVSGPDYLDKFYWLGGWCTYFPYRTINLLGGYDESFPNGYGVDIDYSYRIKLANLDMLRINYWVDHHQMNSREHDNDPDTEKMKQESAAYFRRKHNVVDR